MSTGSHVHNENLKLQIRWIIRRDMQEVLEIERHSHEHPWGEDEFRIRLRQRNCVGMAAEHNQRITGFMIYLLERKYIHLLNFAVHPAYYRQGVGSALVQRLIEKLVYQLRGEIIVDVPESNLRAQLFLKSQGFWATDIIQGFCEDTGEDAYRMKYFPST